MQSINEGLDGRIHDHQLKVKYNHKYYVLRIYRQRLA
jgi:hypothetical protein